MDARGQGLRYRRGSSGSRRRCRRRFDISFAFNRFTLGDDFCREQLGVNDEQLDDPSFDLLAALGFTRDEIEEANVFVCGTMTSRARRI